MMKEALRQKKIIACKTKKKESEGRWIWVNSSKCEWQST
jgi:hypothetical protein